MLAPLKAKPPLNAAEIRRGPLGRWFVVPAGADSNLANISPESLALSGLLDPILESHREFKNQRYAAKKADPHYKGPRIVAEGDSWFEYPYNDDIVMVLGEKYAIMSLAKAGDAFGDVVKKNELFPAVASERPDIVLLSLGGNDVMGSIETYIHQFELNRPAAKYILPNFEGMLSLIENQFRAIIGSLLSMDTQVILHGYDYPDAREPATQGAQWIGPPLKNMRNIDGVAMWREIANIMLDRFNHMLAGVSNSPAYGGRVHYVSLLGTIGNANYNVGPASSDWNDEIHGSAKGFKRLAAKLDAKIKQISHIA
jgi:N-acetylmuramoyl-L-alanine amidase